MLSFFKTYTPQDLINILNDKVFNASKAEATLKNINIKQIDNNGMNFYHHIVQYENIEAIKWLSRYKLDVNQEADNGSTPLSVAGGNGRAKAISLLVQKGANPNKKNKFGRTPLQEVAMQGNLKGFETLYPLTKEKTNLDNNDLNLLHLAMQGGNIDLIQKIISLNIIDINQVDGDGKTILFSNHVMHNVKILKILIDNEIDLLIRDNSGNGFLYYCLQEGKKAQKVLEYAVENGADINMQNNDGKTILMQFIGSLKSFGPEPIQYKKASLDTIKILLYLDSDLDMVDKNGENILFYAIRLGEVSVVEMILENKVDVNCVNINKETPLSITMIQGQDMVQISSALLAAGALPNIKNIDGKTIIERLIDINLYITNRKKLPLKEKKYIKEKGKYIFTLEMAISSNADLSILTSNGEPYFFEPIFYGNLEIVKLLKINGIDMNLHDKDNKNIIFKLMSMNETFANEANKKQYLSILTNLIPMGVDLTQRDAFGGTVLHKAVLTNDEQTIKILISAGADLSAIDSRGRNMIHNSVWSNRIKVFRLLYSYNIKLLNMPDNYGVLPINYAAFLGYWDMAIEMLDAGSQVNNPYKKTTYILEFLEKLHSNLKTLSQKANTTLQQQKIKALVDIMIPEFNVK